MFQSLLAKLRQIVGDNHVLTDGDLSTWELDWRRRERGKALAVVRPSNTVQVAEVVKACSTAGISIVPQGGNTGMVVGSTPDTSGTQIVLSLQRMQQVRKIDASNMTITLEAGCILQQVQTVSQQAGFLFPLRMASEGSCTLGGNLATNAGGTQVLRYGNARELCLGLEVVTSQGDIWDGLTGLRKDNTGYDLRHLMIGSEGTLGIITAAVMRLYPLPTTQLTAMASVPSLEAAVQLLGLAHRFLNAGLTGFEVMNQFARSLVVKHFSQIHVPFPASPFCVVVENSDHESDAHAISRFESLLQSAMEQGIVTDAVVAHNTTQSRALWHVRESIPLAQAVEGLNIKHDISLAVSQIPEFVQHTDTLLQQHYPGVRLVNYGHLGDGNLHYNVQAPTGLNPADFLTEKEAEINTLVYDAVTKFKGSISAEHGIGSLKRDKLALYKPATAMSMMRSIKQALDPQGTLNPHRVL